MPSADDRRAAQYVRMSTDLQRYSIENQSAAIAFYAARRGLTIVRSYEDSGRSGLRLDRRHALKKLINDVQSGSADFDIILVYDVSRWGRFQDADESAHYEFICKQAGVRVEYCAEEFENDGSLMATIVKSIKRAMAGEFSRELSARVFAGQSRLAAMGFHVGGTPGYSLRRHLIGEDGIPKLELAFGQRKNLQTERVILVPGPAQEVETVHHVYDLFIDEKQSLAAIARALNACGGCNANGHAWTAISVRELLSNEKYMGNNVYARTSKKLNTDWRRNPSNQWVRRVGAFEPVVSAERFTQAQRQLKENASHYSDNELLDILTAIWCREKHLSRDIVDGSPGTPSTNTYKNHFGQLTTAFRRIGFTSARLVNHRKLWNIRRAIRDDVASCIAARGGTVEIPAGRTCQLRINGELNVTITIGRTSRANAALQQNKWQFGYRSLQKPDLLIVARIGDDGSSVQDYFVLPFLFLPAGSWLTVSGRNYRRLERFRVTSLQSFYELCARKSLSA